MATPFWAFSFLHGTKPFCVSTAHPHMLGRCVPGLDHSAILVPFVEFNGVVNRLIQGEFLGRLIKHVVYRFEESFPFEVDVQVGRIQHMKQLPLGVATLFPSGFKHFCPCCAGDGRRLFPRASVLENPSVRIQLPCG